MRYLGIDPGKKGGLVVLDKYKRIYAKEVMPMIGYTYDVAAIKNFIVQTTPDHAFIEKVSAVAGASAKSTFQFGFGAGILEGILGGLEMPRTYIRPKEWQKFAHKGIDGTDPKDKSLTAVKQRYPNEDWLVTSRSTKPHDGLIDAALICEYGIVTYIYEER